MITKETIVGINKEFDNGILVNKSSLDFALSYAKHSKDWLKQLSLLVRSISLDHVFEEGNKRTASALIMGMLEEKKLAYDPQKVDALIIEIILKNIRDTEKIRRLIRNAIR